LHLFFVIAGSYKSVEGLYVHSSIPDKTTIKDKSDEPEDAGSEKNVTLSKAKTAGGTDLRKR
jgi:hypothetical protein